MYHITSEASFSVPSPCFFALYHKATKLVYAVTRPAFQSTALMCPISQRTPRIHNGRRSAQRLPCIHLHLHLYPIPSHLFGQSTLNFNSLIFDDDPSCLPLVADSTHLSTSDHPDLYLRDAPSHVAAGCLDGGICVGWSGPRDCRRR